MAAACRCCRSRGCLTSAPSSWHVAYGAPRGMPTATAMQCNAARHDPRDRACAVRCCGRAAALAGDAAGRQVRRSAPQREVPAGVPLSGGPASTDNRKAPYPPVRLTLRRAVSTLVPPLSSRPAPSARREYSRTPYPSVRLTLCPPRRRLALPLLLWRLWLSSVETAARSRRGADLHPAAPRVLRSHVR